MLTVILPYPATISPSLTGILLVENTNTGIVVGGVDSQPRCGGVEEEEDDVRQHGGDRQVVLERALHARLEGGNVIVTLVRRADVTQLVEEVLQPASRFY